MITHKLKEPNQSGIIWTECNLSLAITIADGSYDWKNVTCKRCLKKDKFANSQLNEQVESK